MITSKLIVFFLSFIKKIKISNNLETLFKILNNFKKLRLIHGFLSVKKKRIMFKIVFLSISLRVLFII